MYKYGIRGAFHLNSNRLLQENALKKEEVKELFKNQEVSVHTVTHPFTEFIPNDCLLQETIEDRKALETIVGYPVKGMSYPMGSYNENTARRLEEFGIVYSRTTNATHNFNIPEDFLKWHPTCHHKVEDLMEKAKVFKETTRRGKPWLFYVWGHSYEFNNNDNWNVIEEFCEYISGDDDIWYATNIEIYNYLRDLRRLEFSADCSIVYNPTAATLWFTAGPDKISVKSGETKAL
jgi:peptidoglycan/xylan/chitin deacetylase (PgdA/CDA1 family)